MMQKKICLLGSFAVGKTSLVSRYVSGTFSDKYLTTIGVKIDKRVVEHDGRSVNLIVWDLAGEDAFTRVEAPYLRGAAGYFLVADGTRADTLDRALDIRSRASEVIPEAPAVLLLNKADLSERWELDEQRLGDLSSGLEVRRVSAKNGDGVEDAFRSLTAAVLTATARND